MSRQQFAHKRLDVEKKIEDWHAPIKPPVKPKPEVKAAEPVKVIEKPPVKPVVERPIVKPVENPIPKPVEHKPVSLSSLTPVKNNQKDVTPQRVNELKNALASVLGSHKVDKKPEPKSQVKEVPEDVLRDVLKVE
jgi:hypothetical protein